MSVVTFPGGSVTAAGEVLHCFTDPRYAGSVVVVLSETCFHPLDISDPGQPSDVGWLRGSRRRIAVSEAVVCRVSDDGSRISVVTNADDGPHGDDVCFGQLAARDTDLHVGHVLAGVMRPWFAPGQFVMAGVDARMRLDYSLGHTARHVTTHAFRQVLAEDGFRDRCPRDAGNTDLGGVQRSARRVARRVGIDLYAWQDLAALGLSRDDVEGAAVEWARRVEERVALWVGAGGPVRVDPGFGRLTTPRRWSVRLGDEEVSRRCTGTHVSDLSELGRVSVDVDAQPEGLRIATTCRVAGLAETPPYR